MAHFYMFLYNGGTEGTSVGAPGVLRRVLTGAQGAGQEPDQNRNDSLDLSPDEAATDTQQGRAEKMV